MANETEISNIARRTDDISEAISAALVEQVVCLPLVYMEDTNGHNVRKFRKDGSLTAEAIAESGSYSFSASSELTQSSVTATATKAAVASKLTVEAQEFTTMDIDQLAMKQAQAIARYLDDQVLALFDGFSTQVTATSTLTVDDLMDSIYNVHSGFAGGPNIITILELKGANELKKEVISSGATAFVHERNVSILGDNFVANNGFVGGLPGSTIYATTGQPTSGSDDVALTYNADMAIAGLISPGVRVQMSWEGSAGGYWELYSYTFEDFVEWNDAAGVGLLSNT